jgi:hypothetical protein
MIVINLNKAKDIAHDIRRAARAEEFKPLDDIIAKQIPGTSTQEVEAQRQIIRDKYAEKQIAINEAATIEQLKEAL